MLQGSRCLFMNHVPYPMNENGNAMHFSNLKSPIPNLCYLITAMEIFCFSQWRNESDGSTFFSVLP